jgi:hypothetical protein
MGHLLVRHSLVEHGFRHCARPLSGTYLLLPFSLFGGALALSIRDLHVSGFHFRYDWKHVKSTILQSPNVYISASLLLRDHRTTSIRLQHPPSERDPLHQVLPSIAINLSPTTNIPLITLLPAATMALIAGLYLHYFTAIHCTCSFATSADLLAIADDANDLV